ncbi:OsmC family peroxiredoxin [Demequina lignilytica]|uniref:OsmC family peroxiredoxin n=1 Tax=Demequina lignilytica TaxID=3051663 RepID=A0AB35MDZ4_9MICO|nr:OsmC family peroxiredoxin [Demequina sp. SYSU T0a273]MDN4481988.1 OsmC family peroxiredoxin [Demequina sp. SYSU T0a273]
MEIASKAAGFWNGGLSDGAGTVALGSGNGEFAVTWKARSAGQEGATTPEELLAAAHASCFSMALSHALEGNGTPPDALEVGAEVRFEAGKGVTASILTVRGTVPGLDQDAFARFADEAKAGCPVSQALAGVPITLADATLVG